MTEDATNLCFALTYYIRKSAGGLDKFGITFALPWYDMTNNVYPKPYDRYYD